MYRIYYLLFIIYIFPSCVSVNNKSAYSIKKLKNNKQHHVFTKGVKLFHKKKLIVARKQFEKLNLGDKDFFSALLEIQKINYIKNNWDRFFGLAIYYRSQLNFAHKISFKNYKQELLVLEILALIRHCQFTESKKLIKWSIALAKKHKQPFFKIKKTIYFMNLKALIKNKKKETKTLKFKNQINIWNIKSHQLNLLDNPKHVNMKVIDQC